MTTRRVLMLAGLGFVLSVSGAAAEDAAPAGGLKGLPGAVKEDVGNAAKEEMEGYTGKATGAEDEAADDALERTGAGSAARKADGARDAAADAEGEGEDAADDAAADAKPKGTRTFGVDSMMKDAVKGEATK
jgi:hypothetical protein